MRLLAGVLAAHPFTTTLFGDASLSRRPMRRVIAPLTEMGARFEATPGDRPPLVIHGERLHALQFQPEVPSAQVKSAVLLAGLHVSGTTSVTEPAATRDHTERALEAFGAPASVDGRRVSVTGGRRLRGRDLRVPGDLSSAAFPAVAAAALPGSDVTIEGVGLNPSRAAILDLLRRFGALVEAQVTERDAGEPVGYLRVRHGSLDAVEILPEEVPEVIDELPVLAALATFGGGLSVSGAGELRVKESDRISALVGGLRAMGADADERPDGFTIRPTRRLTGGAVDAHGDHRLAMAFAIAGLGASGPTTIAGAEVVAVSYPGFFADLDTLRA
jgi:3-phosphoshikimate 1-carboxyvinyltransferase